MAFVEHSPCPADWVYHSVLFSSYKKKHPVDYLRPSVAIIPRRVVSTIVVTLVPGATLSKARPLKSLSIVDLLISVEAVLSNE